MALHVMTVLAYKEGDRVTSSVLAGSVNTNPVIIRRLLLDLQKARLVDTCKGAGCGSRLNRAPGSINLAEIFRAVEAAEPFTRAPRQPNSACPVGHGIRKAVQDVFDSARNALEQDLEKTTLADLAAKVKHSSENLAAAC